MKKLLLILVTALVATAASAKLDPDLKKAFKYRTDISKEALAKIKKWPDKTGIIHGDWIENRNGRSIDLQGNDLFPSQYYSQLEQGYDSLFVMSLGIKRGVITRSGRLIIPLEYDAIDFSYMAHGLILARNYDEECIDGNGQSQTYDFTHVFTATGKEMDRIMDLGRLYVQYVPSTSYANKTYRGYMALMSTYNKNESLEFTDLFYMNGDKAAVGIYAVYRIQKITNDSLYTSFASGDTAINVVRTMSKYDTSSPDVLRILSNDEVAKLERNHDRSDYMDNYWIKKALEYYNNKEYDKAAFCFNYYGKYERSNTPIDKINSVPCYLFYLSLLSSYYNAGDYKEVMQIVQNGGITKDRGIYPYLSGNHIAKSKASEVGKAITLQEYSSVERFYSQPYGFRAQQNGTYGWKLDASDLKKFFEQDRDIVSNALKSITSIYNSSVTAYQQKQQANAALFGAILGAVAGTVSNIAGGNSGSGTTATGVGALSSGSTVSSSSTTTSSSSSSSSSSSTQTQTKKRCVRCSGSGTCIRCKGSGKETTFSGKSTTVCGMCHGNGKCLSCNGLGYHQY